MAAEGLTADGAEWQALLAATTHFAGRALRDSQLMARMNGMEFDAAEEESLAGMLAAALRGC
jgi:hypothetical protein